jgi:P4 family phage/plasmid primase-like protien
MTSRSKFSQPTYNFLKENPAVKIGTSESYKYNILSIGNPKGKFLINESKIPELYKVIFDCINKENITPSLIQKPDEISPIILDIDFRQLIDVIGRIYTISLIKDIFNISKDLINKTLKVNDEFLKMYLFEKKNLVDDKGRRKDGIHIMFPFIHIDSNFKRVLLMELKNTLNKKYFEDMGYLDGDKVLDDCVFRNCWPIYGCSKPNCEPYRLTHIYDKNFNDIKFEHNIIKIMNDCSVFYNSKYEQKYISKEIQKSITDKVNLSNNKIVKETIENANNKHVVNEKTIKYILKKPKSNYTKTEIEFAKSLVMCLKSDYYDDYSKWFNVGIALHNISSTLSETWNNFSKQSKKYDQKYCNELWAKFDYMDSPNKLTLGSLVYWTKISNPDLYIKMRDIYTKNSYENMKSQTNNSVAKAFCDTFGDNFVSADLKNDKWYKFDNNRWIIDDKGVSIRKMLSNEFKIIILNEAIKYSIKASNPECKDEDRVSYLNKNKTYNEIAIKLETTSYKNNVMKEISEFLYQPDFIENLDKNKSLMGFNNGVYDFDSMEFRDGMPCDNISLCTNIDYVPFDYNIKNAYFGQVQNEVYEMIENIHPDPTMRNYVFNLMASICHGLIKEQKFHIWTGTGSNGKSMLIDLLKNSLGDYAVVLPTTMITSKKSSSAAANPELVKTKGVRFCVLQEPEDGAQINTGTMKELSAGDEQTARGLFCNPIRFQPQFTLVMTCNHLPHINSNDGGTWRRINVIEFGIKFCRNPRDDHPNEKKADEQLLLKVSSKDFKEAFMSIIINQYRQYSKHGIKEPEEVIKYTKEYQERSDVYEQFINDVVEKTDNNKNILKIMDIYNEFSNWFKRECNSLKVPKRGELKLQLEDKIGKMSTLGWKGYRIKIYDNDGEDSGVESDNE